MARPKILLVDDTRLVLELEKSYLKFSEVDILTAGNGREALEMIRRDPPDLIFMDVNMPEMDGIACLCELKKDIFLCDIPVIMLTTMGRDQDRARAAEAGCNGYLTKPIDRREFLAIARKYTAAVDRRQLRIRCRIPLLLLIDGAPVDAHALDFSVGGAYLVSPPPVRQGAALKMAFYLPGAAPTLMELTGRIAWVNGDGHRVKPSLPVGFGVEFLEIDEQISETLAAFLEADQESRACDGTP